MNNDLDLGCLSRDSLYNEPLLLEGYGLRKRDGTVALCISAYVKSLHPPTVYDTPDRKRDRGSAVYEYEMFDEGEIQRFSTTQVIDILNDGGRIIITEI